MLKNEIIEKNVTAYLGSKNNKYFAPIFENLYHPLLNFILKKINNYNEANEVLSYAFEKIYLGLRNDKYIKNKNAMFSTWAHTVTKNAMLYYFREHKKFMPYDASYFLSDKFQTDTTSYESELSEYQYKIMDFTDTVKTSIYNIEDEMTRIIGIDFYLKNKKIKEICEDYSKHKSFVKLRLMRVRKLMRVEHGENIPRR